MTTINNPPPGAFTASPPPLRPVVAIHASATEPNAHAVESSPLAVLSAPVGSRAVLYLRVSSKGQLNTDYDPEGISIPAQRVACERKAEQLGLTVVAEFIEPGRSATEMTKRVAFQQMLERIRRDKDVDFVIVHKLSRFTRNRLDDAIVMADLNKRGVELISATEQIDASPEGQLMHGILATFNQYRSAADGADIAYKMGQKAKNGGTLGRAPIGYLNAPDFFEGRKVNSVIVDPERAPFVQLAFEMYATGESTLEDIVNEWDVRGFTTRRTAHRPAGSVAISTMARLLRDRYYIGETTYKGETFKGRHEPIVERDLFNKVQDLLDATGHAGERRRIYESYLKGSLWCGECYAERGDVNRRMIIQRAVGRTKAEYFYFFCRGRQEGVCRSRHLPIDDVEDAVVDHYRTIRLAPDFIAAVKAGLDEIIRDQQRVQEALRRDLANQLNQLEVKADNLVDLVATGGLASARATARIREIEAEREIITERLKGVVDDVSTGVQSIRGWLELLEDPHELYKNASNEIRRQLNQAIFTKIFVVDNDRVESELTDHARALIEAQAAWRAAVLAAENKTAIDAEASIASFEETSNSNHFVNGWSKNYLVDLGGLEPPTPCMPCRCA
uniref:recombinase family protein n=1 Tax=uncultured Microbacterium sp. TaxID=191216 RepID=UPI0025D2BEF9